MRERPTIPQSQVFLDVGLPEDRSAAEGYDDSVADLNAAIAASITPLNETCGVMLRPGATP